jgi:hypothetical protein
LPPLEFFSGNPPNLKIAREAGTEKKRGKEGDFTNKGGFSGCLK